MQSTIIKNECVPTGKIKLTLDTNLLSIYDNKNLLIAQGFVVIFNEFENFLFMNDICDSIPLIEKAWGNLTK